MKRLKAMAELFQKITAGVLFVTAVYIPVFYGWDLELGPELLWQIMALSAVCTLGSVILPLEGEQEVARTSMLIRFILYYAYINGVVLAMGDCFEWFSFDNGKQVFGMLLAIAFVYLAVACITYWMEYREAEKMNQKLKER